MIELFNTVLYQPILNLLVWLYNIIPGNDIGLAIIILTVIIKILLAPFTLQSLRSQKALQELQPKMEAIKKQYSDNKEKLASETMKLYKEQKVNPLSSCLPILIQFPFLIAVYQAFRVGLTAENLELIYPFIHNPGHINALSFGLVNLAAPSLILAIMAGIAQFFQTKMMSTKKPAKDIKASKDESAMASMNKTMLYFMPAFTVIIGASLPGGLTLYWLVTTLLTIAQQQLFMKPNNKPAIIEGEVITK
jgi:YidC/Oxa1 family membrane protein insertase